MFTIAGWIITIFAVLFVLAVVIGLAELLAEHRRLAKEKRKGR